MLVEVFNERFPKQSCAETRRKELADFNDFSHRLLCHCFGFHFGRLIECFPFIWFDFVRLFWPVKVC